MAVPASPVSAALGLSGALQSYAAKRSATPNVALCWSLSGRFALRAVRVCEKLEHCRLDAPADYGVGEIGATAREVFDRPDDRDAGVIAIDHARVHVGRAADRWSVAEVGGHRLDGAADLALAARTSAPGLVRNRQRDGRENRRVPSAKVLSGEVACAVLLDVGVDVLCVDLDPAARLAIGKQLRAAAPALERRHDSQCTAIGNSLDSALP